jgi:glycosyltransferase involved in cell wall biosynthesis
MKLAMLTPWKEACGIADYARELVEGLGRGPGLEVEVVPLDAARTDLGFYHELAQRGNQADLVHVQHEYIYFGGLGSRTALWPHLAAALRVPYVVTLHTQLHPATGGPPWMRLARAGRETWRAAIGWTRERAAGQFRGASRVLVHTSGHRQALLDAGLPANRVVVMPDGVPASGPKGSAAAARRRWDLPEAVVTLPGFLNPTKGHQLALEAWDRLDAPEAQLVIAGRAFSERDAVYAREVERWAAARPGRVRVLGYLKESELADLLAASRVVLLPYLQVTASAILARALAQGRAVLASDLESFREMNREEPCVDLFRSGDAADLAARLKGLLADPGRREALSRAAGAWAGKHDWAAVAKSMTALYREVLRGR